MAVTIEALTLLQRDDPDQEAACTLQTCPLSSSYYAYLPSHPANALFLALFSLSLCSFLLQAVLSRRFIGFSIAMICGCILEVLGYVGRIMSHHDPFSQVRPPSPSCTQQAYVHCVANPKRERQKRKRKPKPPTKITFLYRRAS